MTSSEREEEHEPLRQSLISAWNDYRSTDMHATLLEATDLLSKLEASRVVEPPECHT